MTLFVQVLFENQGRASKNKAVDLEDMKFHQCVRLTRFENDRTISFIPPDGAFDLMCAPAGSPGDALSQSLEVLLMLGVVAWTAVLVAAMQIH